MKLSVAQQALINSVNYGFVATLMPDGSPQVSPVWLETDGEFVSFSTVPGRLKDRNLRKDPRVAIAILDSADPENRQVLIQGTVVEITTEGAIEQINRLSRRFLNVSEYPGLAQGQERVSIKVRPDRLGGYL